jgi:AcrR family transcriptional regulator
MIGIKMAKTPQSNHEPSARERILETASALFYAQGYRAIGVDRLIAESGVAKMTFYRHFPSKDDLIRAYLDNASKQYWFWIDRMITEHSTPRAQLESIFEGVAKVASSPQCLGCAWMHAAAEFPDRTHPGHVSALEFKHKMLAKLEELSRAAKARDPEGLAQDLMLVMDGAWAAARVFGTGNHGARAGITARNLIAAQLE